jgi:hypothetical protein
VASPDERQEHCPKGRLGEAALGVVHLTRIPRQDVHEARFGRQADPLHYEKTT